MIQRIQNSKWVFVLISVFLAVIFWMYVRNDLGSPGEPDDLQRTGDPDGRDYPGESGAHYHCGL